MAGQYDLISKGIHILILLFGVILSILLTDNALDPLLTLQNDDLMRLVQVRDLMAGQSWFDTVQYRLGLEAGVQIHWSRFVDLPIVIVIWIANIFVPIAQAEAVVFYVWPFTLFVLTYFVACRAAYFYLGSNYSLFAPLMVMVLLATSSHFAVGGLDHHNIQILSMMVALCAMFSPENRFLNGFIGGAGCAFSLAIGLETIPYVAWLCLWPAVLFILKGEDVIQRVMGFGIGFALTFLVSYILTWPVEVSEFRCDDFGADLAVVGIVGALGLTVVAAIFANKNSAVRSLVICGLGIVTILTAIVLAPSCLGNPLHQIHPIVTQEWLSRVQEAQPLLSLLSSDNGYIYYSIPIMAGISLILLFVIALKDTFRTNSMLLIGLILLSFSMSLYQLRGQEFLKFFTYLPFAFFAGYYYNKYRLERHIAHFGLTCLFFAMSNQTFWVHGFDRLKTATMPIHETTQDISNVSKVFNPRRCEHYNDFAELASLPVGNVIAGTNHAVTVLAHSQHQVLASNFHRNHDGIRTLIQVINSPSDQAEIILREKKITYVLSCEHDNSITKLLPKEGAVFWKDIRSGNIPEFLERVSSPDAPLQIYKVKI